METTDPEALLQKISEIEKELEEIKIAILKMKAEKLPVEEVEDEDLRKRFEEYRSGKAKFVSSEEAVRSLQFLMHKPEAL